MSTASADRQPLAEVPPLSDFAPLTGAGALAEVSSPTEFQHSPLTRWLHWASVIAIVVCAAAGLLREVVQSEYLRALVLEIHRQAGLFVLVALGVRIAARLRQPLVDHAADMPLWQRMAAHGAHLAMYGMLLVLPVLGIMVSHAHGAPLRLFGFFTLPSLVEADADLADDLTDYHIWAAWGMLALVVAHVGAAVWHHRVRKDGVLAAMWPTDRLRR
jgi:cytochrome b561